MLEKALAVHDLGVAEYLVKQYIPKDRLHDVIPIMIKLAPNDLDLILFDDIPQSSDGKIIEYIKDLFNQEDFVEGLINMMDILNDLRVRYELEDSQTRAMKIIYELADIQTRVVKISRSDHIRFHSLFRKEQVDGVHVPKMIFPIAKLSAARLDYMLVTSLLSPRKIIIIPEMYEEYMEYLHKNGRFDLCKVIYTRVNVPEDVLGRVYEKFPDLKAIFE